VAWRRAARGTFTPVAFHVAPLRRLGEIREANGVWERVSNALSAAHRFKAHHTRLPHRPPHHAGRLL